MAAKEEKIGAVASKSAPEMLPGWFLLVIITHLSSKVFHPFWGFLTMILFPRMQELQDHASTDCGWPQTWVYATSTLQSRVVVAMTTSMPYIPNMPWVLHTSTLHYTPLYVPLLCSPCCHGHFQAISIAQCDSQQSFPFHVPWFFQTTTQWYSSSKFNNLYHKAANFDSQKTTKKENHSKAWLCRLRPLPYLVLSTTLYNSLQFETDFHTW